IRVLIVTGVQTCALPICPLLDRLKVWFEASLARVSGKSELAGAIRYALSRWPQLTRYRDDGRIEIDNNAAERAIRAIALGRKNRSEERRVGIASVGRRAM